MSEKKRWNILLTGGSHGIGETLVHMLCEKGHQVVFTGRNEENLNKVASQSGATPIKADVSNFDDNERTVQTALKTLGGIDVLINNAAWGYGAPIGEMDVNTMRQMFDTNVFGLVDLTNRVVPHLKKQESGDIVNLCSTSGMKGHPNGTSYAGSKWALRGISQCWQMELRPHNIRVFCVCPSEVQTGWGGKPVGSNPKKLFAEDIGHGIISALEMHPRGFIPEFAVYATNPF